MARLYVICGNCGCSDEWELRISRDGSDVTVDEVKFEGSADMVCLNCHTIHDLKDNAKKVTLS